LEARIAGLAADQHDVVALWQLRGLGMSASAVRSRVAGARWRRVHAGVYAVGHAKLTAHGRCMAAVLACGPDALVCHRSAAALLGLRADNRARIDVASPRRAGRGREGIVAHRATGLLVRDRPPVNGIPCTSVARTLLDLAEVIDRRGLERAIDRAEQLRMLDMNAISDVLDRARGRRGAPILRAVVSEHDPASTLTASELEEAFLLICLEGGVPHPRSMPGSLSRTTSATALTSCGVGSGSLSKPTVTPRTAPAAPSSTTAIATNALRSRVGA
jgi:hypothetical protein